MADSGPNRISFFQGNTHRIRAMVKRRLTSGVEVPMDLTGAEARLSIKRRPSDTEYALQILGIMDAPTTGEVVFDISADDSARLPVWNAYHFDVQIMFPSTRRIFTVIRDTLEVREPVTVGI